MKNNIKIPVLRFKGFSEEWKEKLLGERILIQRGGSPRPIEKYITTEGNGVNWIKIGDVKEGTRYIESTVEKIIPEGVSKSRKVYSGDLILSNSMSFGRPYILKIDGCIHDGWLLLRDNDNIFNKEYLLQLLSSSYTYKQYYSLASGGVVNNLNSALVKSTKVLIPPFSEQTQIGQYFQKLDKLSVLQEQKLTKLSQLKTAMLQKMFPKENADIPEIRFKGFSGKWERKRLDDVFFFNIPTNTYSRSELDSYVGEVKNIHYGDILIKFGDVVDVLKEEIPFYSKGKAIDFKSQTLKEGDVIFADTAEDETVGKVIELINIKEESIISGLHTIPARPKFEFAKGFLGYYLNSDSFHNQLLPLLQGTKVSSISKSNLKISFLKYPKDKNEQIKIGRYFQKLDLLLEQSQLKIDKLKHLKQAMLQKMFV